MTHQQLAWARQPLASSSHALVAYPHPDGWARVVRNHLPNGEVSWRWTVHWPYRFSRSGSAQNEAAAIQAATESYWQAFKSTPPIGENANPSAKLTQVDTKMPLTYRVVDLRNTTIDAPDIIVAGASSPEDAVGQALGIDVVRSGPKRTLVARVYWQNPGRPVNMCRLYERVGAYRS